MLKLYYPTPDELQDAIPINEGGWGYEDNRGSWFARRQHLLLLLANTDAGRDLLCIDKYPYPVVFINKNMVTFDLSKDLGPGYKLSDVRVGAKWGNVVRYRWKHVNEALKRTAFQQMLAWPQLGAKPRLAAARFTSTTVYPDPNPETSTVDGRVRRVASTQTWAGIRDGAGTQAQPDISDSSWMNLQSSSTNDRYSEMVRAVALFDATAIDDADALDSAILSIRGTGATNALTASMTCQLVASGPASNTALVAGDYDLPGNWGSTLFATGITEAAWNTSGYNAFTLNASGEANVSFTAISKFGTRNNSDIDDTAHGGPFNGSEDRVNGYFADQTGTSDDPKLVIVHSTPTSFVPKVMVF